MRGALAAAAIALAACGRPAASPPVENRASSDDGTHKDDTRMITSKDGLAGMDDQIVTVVGVYTVQDLGRYRIVSELADGTELQSNKLSYLQLDDGSTVRLGARPDDERARLLDQRVAATGTYKAAWPPPQPDHVAQPNAKPTLVRVTAVEPAP